MTPRPETRTKHRRCTTGCYTCRLRRKKCDEGTPECAACTRLDLTCIRDRPFWWSHRSVRVAEIHKMELKANRDKNKISRKTKGSSVGPSSDSSRYISSLSPEQDPTTATRLERFEYDCRLSVTSNSPSPSSKAEAGFSVSAFQKLHIPSMPRVRHAVSDMGTYSSKDASDDKYTAQTVDKREPLDSKWNPENGFVRHSDDPSSRPKTMQTDLGQNNVRLWNHFIQFVLPIVFPDVKPRQRLLGASSLIPSILSFGRAYLHCCLIVSAQHLKLYTGSPINKLDNEIMKHRCAAASAIRQDLEGNKNHSQVLGTILTLVYFQSVAGQYDDGLPDAPWHQHFEAAGRLVQNFDLTGAVGEPTKDFLDVPYNACLYSWIDILGATMKGRPPSLAHIYRKKFLSHPDSSLGLHELMGCDDRVMYLISEIACLESLKHRGMADVEVRQFVSKLDEQIVLTEMGRDTDFVHVDSLDTCGRLSDNITNAFRIAARILLCSLSPDFDPRWAKSVDLVKQLQEALQRLPSVADGIDLKLNWVYLIGGFVSVPDSTFRPFMEDRLAQLGNFNMFNGMKHVAALLREVWALNDHLWSVGASESPRLRFHWRDVMESKGWDFLLM